MNEFAEKYIKTYEGFDKVVKILLCLLWDIPTCLYRFARSAKKNDVLGMVLAVVLAIFGGWVLFVVDIITLAWKDKVYWLDDLKDAEEAADAPVAETAPATEAPAEAETTVVEDAPQDADND